MTCSRGVGGFRSSSRSRCSLFAVAGFAATETPVFEQALAEERRERIPLLAAFRSAPSHCFSRQAPLCSESARTR